MFCSKIILGFHCMMLQTWNFRTLFYVIYYYFKRSYTMVILFVPWTKRVFLKKMLIEFIVFKIVYAILRFIFCLNKNLSCKTFENDTSIYLRKKIRLAIWVALCIMDLFICNYVYKNHPIFNHSIFFNMKASQSCLKVKTKLT